MSVGIKIAKKLPKENANNNHIFKLYIFAFSSFAMIEKINPIFVLTGWNQAN